MHILKIKRGFTLNELLLNVIIIGVLAAIAMPGINRALRMYRAREAIAGLRTIEAHMRLNRNKTTHWDGGGIQVGSAADNVPGIRAHDLDGVYFRDPDYTIQTIGQTGYTAQAAGNAADPRVAGITVTINQNGLVTENGY